MIHTFFIAILILFKLLPLIDLHFSPWGIFFNLKGLSACISGAIFTIDKNDYTQQPRRTTYLKYVLSIIHYSSPSVQQITSCQSYEHCIPTAVISFDIQLTEALHGIVLLVVERVSASRITLTDAWLTAACPNVAHCIEFLTTSFIRWDCITFPDPAKCWTAPFPFPQWDISFKWSALGWWPWWIVTANRYVRFIHPGPSQFHQQTQQHSRSTSPDDIWPLCMPCINWGHSVRIDLSSQVELQLPFTFLRTYICLRCWSVSFSLLYSAMEGYEVTLTLNVS